MIPVYETPPTFRHSNQARVAPIAATIAARDPCRDGEIMNSERESWFKFPKKSVELLRPAVSGIQIRDNETIYIFKFGEIERSVAGGDSNRGACAGESAR